jgi:hypothetical protein
MFGCDKNGASVRLDALGLLASIGAAANLLVLRSACPRERSRYFKVDG